MKAEFERTKTVENIIVVSLVLTFLAIFILSFMLENALWAFLPAGIWFMVCCICLSCHGEIIAGEKGIVIVSKFFNRKIGKKVVLYSDIDRTNCGVESVGYRYGRVSHVMKLTIKLKGSSRIIVSMGLDIDSSFPASEPDKYKQYIHEQPLMQLSHYIDSKLHLNTSV